MYDPARPGLRGRVSVGALAAIVVLGLTAVTPAPATAQRPAELVGRVVDERGAPVEGVHLELVEAGVRTTTNTAGGYRFRSVSPGRYTLTARRLGYRDRVVGVELEGGRTRVLDLSLEPAPMAVEGVRVSAERRATGGVRLERSEIEALGARSAGGVVESVPGVVVSEPTPGGPETVSIRGAPPDAVLVLVDGVVLNDPITGEADLSGLPVEAIESVTVLPGARSARYGPRAEAGVILIETRRAGGDRSLGATVGSLASRSVTAAWGGLEPLAWGVGGAWERVGGAYEFELPPEVGGGHRRRENADVESLDGWLSGSGTVAGGELRLRGAGSLTDRGLPGKGYAPSRHARQAVDRLQASASWRRVGPGGQVRMAADAARHATRVRDPAPPAGLPYDDTATIESLGLRIEAERPSSTGGDRAGGFRWGGGLELRSQRIEAGQLQGGAPTRRSYFGTFIHGDLTTALGGHVAALSARLRADRDPTTDDWVLNRSITLSVTRTGWTAHLANRSSYSPPTLGDQYFRDAIGVEPNPDLAAERVPSEWEAGARAELGGRDPEGSVAVVVYRGDVRDMIVWAPDFRFVWSPRNVDVKRLGVESRAGIRALGGRLRVNASHTYTRVTYDRPGRADTVQVLYRPRHTASLGAGWHGVGWTVTATGRYTGVRYPVPSPVNALDPFWVLSAGASADLPVGRWTATVSLRADRLLDERSSLIFGFPDPGRRLRLALELRPASRGPGPVNPDPNSYLNEESRE